MEKLVLREGEVVVIELCVDVTISHGEVDEIGILIAALAECKARLVAALNNITHEGFPQFNGFVPE